MENLNIPEFDPENHAYTINGQPAPGVTAIIGSVLGPNPFWTQEARDMGKAVHRAIHYYAENDLDYDSLDEAIKPRLDAYIKFCADQGFKPDLIEQPLYHPTLRYCGIPDQVKIGNLIVDYKNGQKMPQYGLQLAAYANMLPNPYAYDRICLQLLPTGKYKIHPYKKQDLPSDINYFISFLNVFNWKGKNNGRT